MLHSYKYFDNGFPRDPEIAQELQNFIEQVYPIEAERQALRTYLGYCLLVN